MLKALRCSIRRLCSRLRRPIRTRLRKKTAVVTTRKTAAPPDSPKFANGSALIRTSSSRRRLGGSGNPRKTIRVATFNASLFSAAPVISAMHMGSRDPGLNLRASSENGRPRGILKPSPSPAAENHSCMQQRFPKSRVRVSINLPDNEISRQLSFREKEREEWGGRRRSVVEVLRELDADILGLQDVKAEEEKGMKPLSDLAEALGMNFVFAESWAPEYGNAVLSKWPINRWNSQKIVDHTDIRNVLKATIDVPGMGEVCFYCTRLDHLKENLRLKQVQSILRSSDEHHILAGGLNSLDQSDYSPERWTDIVKYHEDMGKPAPGAAVMEFLKGRRYTDAKDFAGECEPVVVIAKGQSKTDPTHVHLITKKKKRESEGLPVMEVGVGAGVQGTCRYGTRVDYIMASPGWPYRFVGGSYAVLSSQGTSGHHIVKVDIARPGGGHGNHTRKLEQQ